MHPFSAGRISLNFISEANDDRVRSSFGPEKYRKLVALKDKYDPENVFRMNQNVAPSRSAR
jgi:FAD/FMN-containing dehydrogenase